MTAASVDPPLPSPTWSSATHAAPVTLTSALALTEYPIQTRPGVAPGYDPIDPGPFYATSVYEPQNQPDLGGPTFYPTSGWGGMLVWRVAMARSAWFKCWVEDASFFRNFNEAYYSSFTDTLPGDIPALRVLASQVLPSVEGMPFQEW